jgi:hypothetical protein
MTEITEKTRKKCGLIKPIGAYRKASKTLGGDGFSGCCDTCRAKMAEDKRAQKAAKAAAAEDDGPTPGAPTLEVGFALGFKVHFEKGDFHISQQQEGALVTIFLSIAELDQLTAFRQTALQADKP